MNRVSSSAGDPPPTGPAPPPRRADHTDGGLRGLATARSALIAHVLSLAGGFRFCSISGSHQWFFTDEWEFITRNLPGQDQLGLFAPHNEHWSTIPVLVYRVLFAVVGAAQLHPLPGGAAGPSCPRRAPPLAYHPSCRCGRHRPRRRSPRCSWCWAWGGSNDWAFQIGFSLSLVCGLGWLLVSDLDLQAPAGVLCGWVLGVAASMSSGIGVPMIGAVAVAELARRGPRAALLAASVPTLANLAWYAAVHPRATLPTTGQQLWMLPQFVWRGLSATADGALCLPLVGSVLRRRAGRLARRAPAQRLAPRRGLCCRRRVPLHPRRLRTHLPGSGSAAASRYLYLCTALLACPAALALTSASRRCAAEARPVAALAVSTLHGAYVLRQNVRVQHAIEANDRAIIMAAASVVSSGATLLGRPARPVLRA